MKLRFVSGTIAAAAEPHILRDFLFVAGRSFTEIRDKCLAAGALWEDDEFPAEHSSIFFSKRDDGRIQWKRPHVSHTSP